MSSSFYGVVPLNPLASVLTSRNISAEEAFSLEMGAHNADEISKYAGNPFPKWLKGTFLPYHDLDGSPLLTDKGKLFCRWRIEREDGKPLSPDQSRYIQPGGSGVAAYLPTIRGINWVEVAHDPTVEIWITEGEFKSIRCCQEGMVTVGLGGVDNWRDKSGKLAKPLDSFVWDKRVVNIVYDADPESTEERPLKPTVEAAFQRATARFGELGAITRRVSIAQTETFAKARLTNVNCKMGVDDFFAAEGTYDELMKTARIVSHNKDAARLLREYAIYQGKKAHIIRLTDGTPFSIAEFGGLIEASAITIMSDPLNPKKKLKVKEHEVWRESKNQLKVDKYVFDPSSRPGYDPNERTYNIWTGWGIEGGVGDDEGGRYNEVVRDWKRFIKGIFGEWDWYFEKWLAHLLQKPAEKTSIAMLLCTKLTGVGKTLLGEMIVELVGHGHAVAMDLDRVVGTNFNALMNSKLFVQIDEAEGRFSGHESKLDDLITSDMLPIEYKGMDTMMVKNYARLFMTSNSVIPIRMKQQNRRHMVIRPDMTQAYATSEWEPWVNKTIAGGIKKSKDGLRLLAWHLSKVDLTGWDPQARVPVTEAMLDMVEASVTKKGGIAEHLVEALMEDDAGYWIVNGDLRGRDEALWGEVKAMMLLRGGRTCTHVWKVGEKNVRGTLFDPHQRLPAKKNPKGDQFVLDNAEAKLSGIMCTEGCKRAAIAYEKYKNNALPSDKY